MSRSPFSRKAWKLILAASLWLYGLLLYAYPPDFRRAYGLRMTRTFGDSCRSSLEQGRLPAFLRLWSNVLADLVWTASLEQGHHLKECLLTMTRSETLPLRLWLTFGASILASLVALVASLNLYMLEDDSPLSQAAYSASALLRFSYDGIYLSALATGVALCALIGYALFQRTRPVLAALAGITLLAILGGLGGLIFRHAATFWLLCGAFLALILIGLLIERGVNRYMARTYDPRTATLLGACAGVGSLLLFNVAALVVHTLLLNPVSHALYMQGRIAGTSLNFSLLIMGLSLLTLLIWAVSLSVAVHQPRRSL